MDVNDMAFQLENGNLEVLWFQGGRCLEQRLQSRSVRVRTLVLTNTCHVAERPQRQIH